jgi:integrase
LLPRWKNRRLQEITRPEVLDLLDELVDQGTPSAANHALAALRGFTNWAVARDLLSTSPCQGIKAPAEMKSRERVLADDELRALWKAADEIGFPFGPITQLLILTGCRRDEVRAMRASELDLKARLWTIDGNRTKNGIAHRVWLSDAALSLLAAAPRVSGPADYVWSTTGSTPPSGFSRAKGRLDALMQAELGRPQKQAPWRLHDIRRTVASGMARLGVHLPVIEKCLNHVSGTFGGIVGVYQRHTYEGEKREAWEQWDRHVQSLISQATGNVIRIRPARL